MHNAILISYMDEFIPPNPRDTDQVPVAYSPDALNATIDNEKWRSLEPNLYSPGHDLLPQELDANQINALVATILKDPVLASIHVDRDAEQVAAEVSKEPIDLGEIGTLTFVGGGEAKVCYCLEQNGRKMAIVLQGYESNLGIQIPDDPCLTEIAKTPTLRTWEYSGLRTYAMLPLVGNRAVKLQEFGESSGGGYMSVFNSLTSVLTRRSAISYIAQHLPNARLGPHTNTAVELQQSDHVLAKPGHKRNIIIDIPVEERIT
jgi:hypothetical protein